MSKDIKFDAPGGCPPLRPRRTLQEIAGDIVGETTKRVRAERLNLAWSAVLEAALRGLRDPLLSRTHHSTARRELERIRDIALAIGTADTTPSAV
jgi:hypothetical protein